jgi:hypothetical protein
MYQEQYEAAQAHKQALVDAAREAGEPVNGTRWTRYLDRQLVIGISGNGAPVLVYLVWGMCENPMEIQALFPLRVNPISSEFLVTALSLICNRSD